MRNCIWYIKYNILRLSGFPWKFPTTVLTKHGHWDLSRLRKPEKHPQILHLSSTDLKRKKQTKTKQPYRLGPRSKLQEVTISDSISNAIFFLLWKSKVLETILTVSTPHSPFMWKHILSVLTNKYYIDAVQWQLEMIFKSKWLKNF